MQRTFPPPKRETEQRAGPAISTSPLPTIETRASSCTVSAALPEPAIEIEALVLVTARAWRLPEPAIEIEVVFRVQDLAEPPALDAVNSVAEPQSPLVGDGRLERVGVTMETAFADEPPVEPEHAVEVTFEGLYELAEESLADGASTLLDDHFGALGGWIAATLVKLADLR